MKTLKFLSAVALVTALSACNSQALDDSVITAKVKAKLAEDSQTSAIKIGVDTTDGVVTLTGTVPTELEKDKAKELAANESGVKKVVNNITVDPNSIGATNAGQKIEQAKKEVSKTAGDDLILTKIKSKLIVAGLSSIEVDVSNGDVVLKGNVKSSDDKSEAEVIARNTDGVKTVKNQLNVKAA